MTSPQNLSPTLLATQKSATEAKQTVSIRKVTIESIAPVVAKVEEHISFLIEETSNLRKQNRNLVEAQANQKALEDQIVVINDTLQKLNSNINTFNRDKEEKLLSHKNQLFDINEKISKIQRDLLYQAHRVEDIDSKNESYLQLINQNKEEQVFAIDSLKSSLDQYYQQELYQINSLNDTVANLSSDISALTRKREDDLAQFKKVEEIVALYEVERQDLMKAIEKTTFLQHNAVMIEDYQQYKKYSRAEMEMTKSEVRKMVDQALTPQIRKFLPTLISKLDELNSFSLKLNQLYSELEKLNSQQTTALTSAVKDWQQKMKQIVKRHETTTIEIKQIIQFKVSLQNKEISQIKQSLTSQLSDLVSEVSFNKKVQELNLNEKISILQQENKDYIKCWGDSFIQQNKEQIYKIVEQMKPKQEVSKEQEMKQIVFAMEPLVKEAKEQIAASKIELEISKHQLIQKLGLFSNQIVKFKTDITRQTAEYKKTIDNFNKKLQNNDELNRQVSLLTSKLVQITTLNLALSLNKQFLKQQKEVYVTFKDGILLELEEGEVKYRRTKVNSELLKRAAIQETGKLIDSLIGEHPLLGWDSAESKPSHFFNQILSSYQALLKQHPQESLVNLIQPYSSTQYGMPLLASSKKHKQSDSLSKTIDFERKVYQTINQKEGSRYEDPKTNRKSIRLKKIEK